MALDGKVAIVTGAGRGIGRAVANRFAQDGAKVLVADVDEPAGAASAEAINDAGGTARFQHCDVGERLDVRNLICAATDAFDRIDVLINNAGVIEEGTFLDLAEEEFDRVVRTNIKGTFLVGQAVAQEMIKQIEAGGAPGTIVNLSSVNAVVAMPDHAAYDASKGAIGQLTKAMAIALAPYGIRVNAIGPGSIDTEMLKTVADDPVVRDRLLSRTPLGRIGKPEEIAGVAAFLASDDASYITGQTLYADGGRLALNYTVPVKG